MVDRRSIDPHEDLTGIGPSTDTVAGDITEETPHPPRDVQDRGGMGGEGRRPNSRMGQGSSSEALTGSGGSLGTDAGARDRRDSPSVGQAQGDDAAMALAEETDADAGVGPYTSTEGAGLWSNDLAGSGSRGGHTGDPGGSASGISPDAVRGDRR